MNSEQISEYLIAFKEQGFSAEQLEQLELGLQAGVDVSIYANTKLDALTMYQLRSGLEEELNVMPYANPSYDWFQVAEIIEGLRLCLDVKKYDSSDLDAKKMKEIRLGLENGFDLSGYKEYDAAILKEIRLSHNEGIDISLYVATGYDCEQLNEIRTCLLEGQDIYGHINTSFSSSAICEISKGIRDNVDVDFYAKTCYNWAQMREIRRGLRSKVDVSMYASPLFDRYQMEQIRLGLEEGLPVHEYCSFMYPASVMKDTREKLLYKGAGDFEEEDFDKFLEGDAGKLEVSISSDDMSAYLLFPKELFGKIHRKDVLRVLRIENITQNIDARMLDDLLSGKHLDELVTIATGRSPIKGEDGHYEFFFDTKKEKTPTILPDGSVDFQNIDWFVHVKRGQKLAYYHSPGKGEPGRSVTGKVLKAERGKEIRKLKGKGFYMEADKKTYVSEYDGRVELRGDVLTVSKDLHVQAVNASTGNIKFDGNVIVGGDVSDGASIVAGGTVIVDGFVENATISAAGDIILKKGANGGAIEGSGVGLLEAGGDIEGKFIENMKVVAKGDMLINYALNSDISTEGSLVVSGNRSLILGGSVFAARGIRVCNLGNASGMRTAVRMGVSDYMLSSQKKIEGHMSDIEGKLQVLYKGKQNICERSSSEVLKHNELLGKIENAIYTLELEKEEYEEKRRNVLKDIAETSDVMLTVTGNLYDNVSIDINGKKIMSTQTNNVSVKITNNKLVICKNF